MEQCTDEVTKDGGMETLFNSVLDSLGVGSEKFSGGIAIDTKLSTQ